MCVFLPLTAKEKNERPDCSLHLPCSAHFIVNVGTEAKDISPLMSERVRIPLFTSNSWKFTACVPQPPF